MARPLTLIALLLGILILIPLSAAIARDTGWYTGPLAAWVQAIGSIAAVAGAALLGVWQADSQRRRDAEQLKLRALQVAEERISSLQTAAQVCGWASTRLKSTAEHLRQVPPPKIRELIPLVAPEFAAFQARLSATNLDGFHRIARENVIAAEGMLIRVQQFMLAALNDCAVDGADEPAIRDRLANNLVAAAGDLFAVGGTLVQAIRRVGADAASILGPR